MCVCMCAVVWCVVYTHEQMLHSFNPARCHQLFSRQTSMVCSGAPAFKGLSCFLIAYDCRSFRWLTHTIQLHANSVTVPSTGYVMCRQRTKYKKKNMKSKRSNILNYFDAPVKRFQWDSSLRSDRKCQFFFIQDSLWWDSYTTHNLFHSIRWLSN